ncbi:hypothetical protein [Fontivita pretiosa]|uniref:hypothetical protein n=1 Tax=Fontivita pretiosa TaxID=2989684 RepID=UPI003D162DB1
MKHQRVQRLHRSASTTDAPLLLRDWSLLVALSLWALATFLVLRSGLGMPRGTEMPLDRAVFTVVNVVTLTGFQQDTRIADFKPTGQAMVLGLMVLAALVILIVGARAIRRILQLPFGDAQIIRATLCIYAAGVLLGASLLLRQGTDMRQAIFHAASAISNAGLILGDSPGVYEWRTHVVLLPLAVVGGLGVAVLLDLGASIVEKRPIHPHTLAALACMAGAYLLGLALIVVLEHLGGRPIGQSLVLGSVEAINTRSPGIPMSMPGSLTTASQWVLMILMSIGACAGSAGGGMTATALFLFAAKTLRLLAGGTAGRCFGLACAWIGLYLLIVLATTIGLIVLEPRTSSDHLLFLAVGAVSTTGLWPEAIHHVGGTLYVLSAAMLLGRFVPLLLLCLAARIQPQLPADAMIDRWDDRK